MNKELDPRPQIYQALHAGDKLRARDLLWRNIGDKARFTNVEWDRLYIRSGGIDEADKTSGQ